MPDGIEIRTGCIIKKTNLIEQKLMHIILKYLDVQGSERGRFLKDILLNNGLINLSAKVKAYRYLNELQADWPSLEGAQWNYFSTIMSIRNAFAHSPLNTRAFVISTNEDGETETLTNYVMYESVSGSGQLQRKSIEVAFREFEEAAEFLDRHLLDVLAILTN
jgi:hypothetical protein